MEKAMTGNIIRPRFDEHGGDKRRFDRVPSRSAVTVFDGERRREGRVVDISGNGALLCMDSRLEPLDRPPEPGRYVDIDMEDLGYVGAQVVRCQDDGFAVNFDIGRDQSLELALQIKRN
jgi:hypothetical protein